MRCHFTMFTLTMTLLFQNRTFNGLPFFRDVSYVIPEEMVVSPQYPVPMVQLDGAGDRRPIDKCSGVLLRSQHNLALGRDVYDAVLREDAHPAELDVLRIGRPYQRVLL